MHCVMWQQHNEDRPHQVFKGLTLTSFSHSEVGQGKIHLEVLTTTWTRSDIPGRTHPDVKAHGLGRISV